MRSFLGFTKRNISLYFSNKMNVVFSLLTSLIIFVLYFLFLKDTFIDGINSNAVGLETFIKSADIKMLANGILLTGILGATVITVPFSCLTTIVKDREHKVDMDILATSMQRSQIILSYLLSAVVCAVLVTSVILGIGLVALSAMGETYISAASVIALFGLVVVGSISSSALFMIAMIFIKTSASADGIFGILSAVSGFVIGAYIPLSQFSESVQTICNIFPATHITVLTRKYILGGILDKMDADITVIESGVFADAIKESFSFEATMFGKSISNANSLLYIGLFAVASIVIVAVLFSKTYKKH